MNRTESLPMVALRGMTILPEMVAHFDISRERSIEAVQEAMASDQKIFFADTERCGSGKSGRSRSLPCGNSCDSKTDHQTAKTDSAGACISRRTGGLNTIEFADPYLRANITIDRRE